MAAQCAQNCITVIESILETVKTPMSFSLKSFVSKMAVSAPINAISRFLILASALVNESQLVPHNCQRIESCLWIPKPCGSKCSNSMDFICILFERTAKGNVSSLGKRKGNKLLFFFLSIFKSPWLVLEHQTGYPERVEAGSKGNGAEAIAHRIGASPTFVYRDMVKIYWMLPQTWGCAQSIVSHYQFIILTLLLLGQKLHLENFDTEGNWLIHLPSDCQLFLSAGTFLCIVQIEQRLWGFPINRNIMEAFSAITRVHWSGSCVCQFNLWAPVQ